MVKSLKILFFLLITIETVGQQTLATRSKLTPSDYSIQDSVLIKTRDGATISAIVMQKKGDNSPKPVILQFTIYVRDKGRDLKTLKESVDNGYIGVIAYSRGKRFSSDEILPYEHDGKDAYDVIDWISKQVWCNGSVGMFGGSYNGFTQWAACKSVHPALKTIVPYVAARPGQGLPMENNIFINPNYEWAFYVANNRYLDTIVGTDRQRYRKLMFKWWETGIAYNKLDSLDEINNKWFQRWISHPSFDNYWQNMTPYQSDFAQIKIPILAFDGYYNDGQSSGLYYIRELQRYSPETPAYLIIGPYGHFGTQKGGEAMINGYKVDSVALFNINKITYQWFDYILKGGRKPEILKDKINYEVIGANEWQSAPTIDKMSNDHITLYLTTSKNGEFFDASTKKPTIKEFLSQKVDFADRSSSNNDYYPDPIIRKEIEMSSGFNFISAPLEETIRVNGSFFGEIYASINKADFDFGVTLYEVMPNGEYFHLSYYIGRASYATDITQRKLLIPGQIEQIPFSNTHLISKQLNKGSRLLVHINVNKNPFSELNYGTGKRVSEETIKDARESLEVKWYNDSSVTIPIWKIR